MKITYDDEAKASYIYFTSIKPGGVAKTIPNQELDVSLDSYGQIITIRLFESEKWQFRNRLKFVLRHPQVTYDEVGGNISIAFVENSEVKETITWDANVDLDTDGQILGLEILFADPDFEPDDGLQRLYAEGKLKHVSKYIVPFDELY